MLALVGDIDGARVRVGAALGEPVDAVGAFDVIVGAPVLAVGDTVEPVGVDVGAIVGSSGESVGAGVGDTVGCKTIGSTASQVFAS